MKPRAKRFDAKQKRTVKASQGKSPRKDKRINLDNVREDKFNKDIDKAFDRNDSNDIRWYSKSPARLEAAGRIPFSSINGVTTPFSNINNGDRDTVPGVMVMRYSPNFLPSAPVIEQAYQNLYSDIVHANSRNQAYDYTDLAILMNAGTELFATIAAGIRIYGLMRNYEEQNTYTPEVLVTAAGFNFSSCRQNFPIMWDDLLSLIAQSRQVWIPNTMPIVERRIWMNLNVYKDADNSRAQYYLYRPTTTYKYQAYTDKRGGKLVANNKLFENLTWPDYVSRVQEMIDALIPDQDRGIMYGDILKAYGQGGIFALNDIALDYRTVPAYNLEVLTQFENANMLYDCYAVEFGQQDLHFYQKFTGWEAPDANWSGAYFKYGIPRDHILNMHQEDQPTPEQLAVATRMMISKSDISVGTTWDATNKVWKDATVAALYIPVSSGTEFLNKIETYKYTIKMTSGVPTGRSLVKSDQVYYNTNFVAYDITAFDWAPAIYKLTNAGLNANMRAGNELNVSYCSLDYDNYATISDEALTRLHQAIIYSLFNVPTLK